ncbi:glutaredoxin [Sulfolobales archaeon HS-7]|nr:glutaredoxin [Sulfolobales archaeon HS-7]
MSEEEYSELFNEEMKNALVEALKDMKEQVEVYVFTDSKNRECRYCDLTVKLMEYVKDSSPKIDQGYLLRVKVVDKEDPASQEVFKKFNVERVPTVAFLDGYLRWTGAPIGEEIRALIETIIRLSQRDSGLSPETVETLKTLDREAKIETIVTPSCPYCPYAALTAHMVAYEAYRNNKPLIHSEVVEAYENPDIADKYQVMSVPTVAVNGTPKFIGVPQEDALVTAVIGKDNDE